MKKPEYRLISRISEGDKKARDEFFEEYYSIAAKAAFVARVQGGTRTRIIDVDKAARDILDRALKLMTSGRYNLSEASPSIPVVIRRVANELLYGRRVARRRRVSKKIPAEGMIGPRRRSKETSRDLSREAEKFMRDQAEPGRPQRARSDRLSQEFRVYVDNAERKVVFGNAANLTPDYLESEIAPYLMALAALQKSINAVRGVEPQPVVIRHIGQQSPVGVSLDGAGDAIDTLNNVITPSRRKHAKQMGELVEASAKAENKKKDAEAMLIRAQAAKQRSEAKKIEAEAAKLLAEAEREKVETEQRKFQLRRDNFNMVLELVERLGPQLTEEEKILHATEMLKSFQVLSESALELTA